MKTPTRRNASCLLYAVTLALASNSMAAEMAPQPDKAVPLPPASAWTTYNGPYEGQRFSPLKQIDVSNVAGLNEICRVRVGELGPFHTGPIIADNTMYLTTSHATLAVNPANCEILWKSIYTPEQPEPWTSNRGVAYWQGKVFRGTPDARLVAYDAATGKELWKTVVGDGAAGELLDSAPLAWNGLVFSGVAGSDFGIKGRMLAFEAATGKPVWQFNLVPQAGEAGTETWAGNSYERGGGGTWTSYALDPEAAEIFVPVANPAPSFDRTARKGDNLYTGSLVVLDALTGKLKWHYQIRPGDDHDYGATAPPLLYSLPDRRKVVALGSKDGFVYVIDRRTRKLVFKRPVVTIKNHTTAPTADGIEICPGVLGGVEWNSPALDSNNQALVVGANDWCSKLRWKPQEYERGKLYTGGTAEMLGKPSGTITSLDASTGKQRWQMKTPNGVVAAITPTAGGLVFAGDLAGTLYALRSTDGEILRQIPTGGAMAGGIITYTVSDQQYVALTSGNVSRSTFGAVGVPTLIIYSLGASAAPASAAATVVPAAATHLGDVASGARSYGSVCASCHGAKGEGAVGPALAGIRARLSHDQLVALIKTPASNKMPTLFPGAVSAQDVEDIAAYIGTLTLPSTATSAVQDNNWPSYSRSDNAQHFSPLADIDADNVSRLGLAWSFDIPGVVMAGATPIQVDGVLYFAAGYSVVRAVDATNGRLLWTYDPEVAKVAGEKLRKGWGIRGLAFADGKVFVGTHDGRLISIDARTGKPAWSVMTLQSADDKRYITGPPLVFKDKVLIGHAGADVGAVRGYVTAYEANTGRELWRFFTVPGDPKLGFENDAMKMAASTWTGEWWKFGGGGTAWNAMTYDAELDRVYIGTGNGAPWNQKIRSPGGGDNLFLCSIVALDANTGRYLWHYQVNPGETWDFNAVMDMPLATLQIGGKTHRVLMQAPKNGFFYVIDRDTGKLLSAEKYVKVTWAEKIDMATGRPVEAADARYPSGEVTIWPGGAGGHSWQPMSFNPSTRLAYIPIIEMPGYYNDKGIDLQRWRPAPGMVPNIGVNMSLAGDVPKDAGGSALLAWDPISQKAAWRVELPGMWNGGTATTSGNLVFQGRADGKFVAYAADTGTALWSFDAQAGIVGAPISYKAGGRQYVSVLAGYGSAGAAFGTLSAQFGWEARTQPRRLLTFALDAAAKLPAAPPPRARVATIDPTYRPDAAAEERGGALWGDHCFFCHGAAAIAGGTAPDLRESGAIVSAEAFKSIVKGGALLSNGMPAFAEVSDAEIEAIRSFLRAQADKLRKSTTAP